ncbi:LacI family DNA-binding transcriptional regulator [Cohnella sp. GCM10027633]|uniref:LacI family DNA-binding transcriptional regulator n=1 Tax=unclassified Cohnella TaxID=2636738 RepID=UPI003626BCCF
MPRPKTVTLRTIASELNLTVHTVSKALRGLPGMSETTRRAVAERARELGYLTKGQEAGIAAERIPWANGKPRRFALLTGGDAPYFDQQSEGARRRLNELGHALVPMRVPGGLSRPAELEAWLDRAGIRHTDGLFLTAGIAEPVETALLALDMPKTLINYPPDLAEVDSAVWDVEYAVHRSMEALHERGHRDVLYVGAIEPQRGFRLRWRAFVAAGTRAGLPPADPAAHMTGSAADREAWMERLRTILRAGGFTAVLCGIPGEAEWVHRAAGSLGLNVPEQLSLVGMEHEEPAFLPALSRPELIVREAGERAAELLLRRIANPTLPFEHVRLKGRFLGGDTIRDSGSGDA